MITTTTIRRDLWHIMVLAELVNQRELLDAQLAQASQAARFSDAASNAVRQITEAQQELGGYIARCCPNVFC